MRFYHRITLALAIVCLFGDRGLGAPSGDPQGRYMWVKCNPSDKNANCVTQMGPLVPLSGQSTRLPPSSAKNIFPVSTEEATPEVEEQLGEGSGNSDTFAPFINMDKRFMRDGPEQEVNKNEEEGSTEFSGDIDYSEYVTPQKRDWLSKEDLNEENIIA